MAMVNMPEGTESFGRRAAMPTWFVQWSTCVRHVRSWEPWAPRHACPQRCAPDGSRGAPRCLRISSLSMRLMAWGFVDVRQRRASTSYTVVDCCASSTSTDIPSVAVRTSVWDIVMRLGVLT